MSNCIDKDKMLAWLNERFINTGRGEYSRAIMEIIDGRFGMEYGDAV